ncbi:ABC transporter permease [candidate division KSB1 bacterium]
MKKQTKYKANEPPRFAERILKMMLCDRTWETPAGDFEEYYNQRVREDGLYRAKLWYWSQVLNLIPRWIGNSILWSVIMFNNYFKITVRQLLKNKAYSAINIFGLSTGLVCSILIMLWVLDEISYDRFHENENDLYVVGLHTQYTNRTTTSASTPTALGLALKQEYPEIVNVARFANGYQSYVFAYENKRFNESIRCVDPSVLSMFTFPLKQGNPETALADPYSVVMTQRAAQKYFGETDPLGETLRVNDKYNFTVTGILEEVPRNSSLRFEILLPLQFLEEDWQTDLNYWDNFAWATYVQLEQNADNKQVNAKIADRLNREYDENKYEVFLSPYSQFHLFYLGHGGGSIGIIIVFSWISLLILLIACINFMNLSTARAGTRAKEIGLRKVVGAFKRDLIKQFYGEAFVFSFASLLAATAAVLFLLPYFNKLTGKHLSFQVFNDPILATVLICTGLLTGIIAGSYPALFMSSISTLNVLKGTAGIEKNKAGFRKPLVIIQFCASIILVILTVISYKQLGFIHTMDLGFTRDNTVYFRANGNIRPQFDAVKQEMQSLRGVDLAVGVSSPMTTVYDSDGNYDWEGRSPDTELNVWRLCTDTDFDNAFNIRMAKGQYFSEDYTSGPSDQNGQVVINEALANFIGYNDPVGKRLTRGDKDFRIIGVVKNFNNFRLEYDIGPMAIYHLIEDSQHGPNRFRYMFIKLKPENMTETLAQIKDVYHKFNPELPFESRFLDDDINAMYRTYEQARSIIQYFAALAAVISCLGLLGLASFMSERRTKEIGIRKTFGSSTFNIILLLSKEFVKFVLIANVIAWPVSWAVSSAFLQNFAFRTDISWGIFIITGVASLLIALLSVGYQTIRAARANPVDSLRYE